MATLTVLRRPVRRNMYLFNEFAPLFERRPEWQLREKWTLPLDVVERDETYFVKASLPGVNPDDIDITLEDNVLTIKAELKADELVENEQYRVRERRTGTFSRSITLPVQVDTQAVVASYEHGILTLSIPKAEAAKPKRIVVKANGHS